MARNNFRRIIKPRLQLKVIGAFTGTAFLCLVFHAVLMMRTLGIDDGSLAPEVIRAVWTNLMVASAVLIPCSFVIGAVITHRIAGPVYRFEHYLGEVADGKANGPCRIRYNDELQELCTAINRAVGEQRSETEGEASEERRAA